MVTTINVNLMTLTQGFSIDGYMQFVSQAGDFNNDGYGDYIVSTGNGGTVYLLFGKASGFTNINLASLTSFQGFQISGGNIYSGQYGQAPISAGGDINKDGYSDILIGASGSQASYVIWGKGSGFSAISLSSLTTSQGFKVLQQNNVDYNGWGVSSGDVNGDGYSDFLTTSYNYADGKGIAYVSFGSSSLTSSTTLQLSNSNTFSVYGPSTAYRVSILGTTDINGDGYKDVIASSLFKNTIYVLYGSASGLMGQSINGASITSAQGFTIIGPSSTSTGYAVSGAGDMNKDGYQELAIGDPKSGIVYVIFGKASGYTSINLSSLTSAQGFTISDPSYTSSSTLNAGFSVKTAGDVNGDKYGDLIIGAPSDNANSGTAFVIFGNAYLSNINLGNLTPSQGFAITTNTANAALGYSVSTAGDINNDGYSDILVSTTSTYSYLIFGAPSFNSSASLAPSATPSFRPTATPSNLPTAKPTSVPTTAPSYIPTAQPSVTPTATPSNLPTAKPTSVPTIAPSYIPTAQPSVTPTATPSNLPTAQPSSSPSSKPSAEPSSIPTATPSNAPTSLPTAKPSSTPTALPSSGPSSKPSTEPSAEPSAEPSSIPTALPSSSPSSKPSAVPSAEPSTEPSGQPSSIPTATPSNAPTSLPTAKPSSTPTALPSSSPSSKPSTEPSAEPSAEPSSIPTALPSSSPSSKPSAVPSAEPSTEPSGQPSSIPTATPSNAPTSLPTAKPSSTPTALPSSSPSSKPSTEPSAEPSAEPSSIPTATPSNAPTSLPTHALTTINPSAIPSVMPSAHPSYNTASPTPASSSSNHSCPAIPQCYTSVYNPLYNKVIDINELGFDPLVFKLVSINSICTENSQNRRILFGEDTFHTEAQKLIEENVAKYDYTKFKVVGINEIVYNPQHYKIVKLNELVYDAEKYKIVPIDKNSDSDDDTYDYVGYATAGFTGFVIASTLIGLGYWYSSD